MIIVRKGNPEGIKSFNDLEQGRRSGHPEPVQLRLGALEHHGRLRLASNRASRPTRRWKRSRPVLEKTKAQPGSARDAFAAFSQGEGNVLLGYENEAIKATRRAKTSNSDPALDAADRNPDCGDQEGTGAGGRRFPQVPLV